MITPLVLLIVNIIAHPTLLVGKTTEACSRSFIQQCQEAPKKMSQIYGTDGAYPVCSNKVKI
jgi:hypothetical protein